MTAVTSTDLRQYPLTVVIATLGGDSLKGTIEALNRGSIAPSEILVCIPAAEAPRVRNLSYRNLRVIVTDCRGQVAQRIIGFRNASHDVVMQIDDDILVEEDCIGHLLTALEKPGSTTVAVAPSLMRLSTGDSVYRQPTRSKMMLKLYYWMMNGAAGYQPGKIDKSGSFVGIDPKNTNDEQLDVESLAGGCVMHYKKNLVLENYYPFEGKAYYEDIVHSYHLRSKGIGLKVVAAARCWLEPISAASHGHGDYLRYLATDFRHRRYSMRLASRESFRIYFFYLANYLNYLGKKAHGLKTSWARDAGSPKSS